MKIILPLLVALAGAFATAQAADPKSRTTAVEVFDAWLSAFNAGDQRVEQFHERYGRGAQDAGRDRDLRERTGGFELVAVESTSELGVVVLLRERGAGGYARLQMDLKPGESPKLAGMRLQPAQRPDGGAVVSRERRDHAGAIANLEDRLGAEAVADRFSGAVLVMREGKVVFERAYGLADRARSLPNAITTRFRIGSMNKMFTAVAILQLVEAGKMSLDDTLAKHLPNYPNADLARRVTIDQLLTHRGGTGDFFTPEYFANKDRVRTLDDYIALVGARPAAFPPGERFEYSNYGYLLLGAIVERASGRSYYDYVQTEIFDRAGMTRTGSEPEESRVADLAIGYTRKGGEPWRPNTPGLPYRGTPAGGGYSTVRDLAAFARALNDGKLLGTTSTDRLLGGYALRGGADEGKAFVGHNGGSPGMNGDLRLYPQSGYVVVALANVDPPAADAVTNWLDGLLPGDGGEAH